MFPTDTDRRYAVAMYLRAIGVILLVLGFAGSIALRNGAMGPVVAVNAAGIVCMTASLWLRRDRMGVVLFLFVGAVLLIAQAGLL